MTQPNRAIMVVFSDPASQAEDAEYNDWYTNSHLADVLKTPGFVAATRYRLGDEQPEGAPPASHRYLAVYEIEVEDVQGALDALVAGRPDRYLSPALDTARTVANVWTPIARLERSQD